MYQDVSLDVAAFPSAAHVLSKTKLAKTQLRQAWKRRVDAISNDPTCFAYFNFEESHDNDTRLVNKALNADPLSDGTIVGGEWAEGRWPGKKAMEFRSVFDRILFSSPGEHEALTCLASLRLDSIGSSFTPLLMPCSSVEGDFRWQIASTKDHSAVGRLRVGRRSSNGWNPLSEYASAPSFRLEQLGTWIQVAFVWDGKNNLCSQYVDGTLVSQNEIQPNSGPTLRTDQMEIGNWTQIGQELFSASQHFKGRIDEFAMFSRALQANQILSYHDLSKVIWSNASKDGKWHDSSNWSESIAPDEQDAVYIDLFGKNAAVFSEGDSAILNEIRVGSNLGMKGELRITGGTLTATKYSNAHTRVGVASGHGEILQQNGNTSLNTLQIGLDPGSKGSYRLEGGSLMVKRGIKSVGSIDIGARGGSGSLEITGGSLMTRVGVVLGRDRGVGEFNVHGSVPTKIGVGAHGNRDGFWLQHSGSTLRAFVDDRGLTPIAVSDSNEKGDRDSGDQVNGGGGNVRFEKNAILEVGFLDTPRAGSWDVMTWEGDLTDRGLKFSENVDTSVWSFEFVDTDSSGKPDTLRVYANEPIADNE
jgi:hypothetical protein